MQYVSLVCVILLYAFNIQAADNIQAAQKPKLDINPVQIVVPPNSLVEDTKLLSLLITTFNSILSGRTLGNLVALSDINTEMPVKEIRTISTSGSSTLRNPEKINDIVYTALVKSFFRKICDQCISENSQEKSIVILIDDIIPNTPGWQKRLGDTIENKYTTCSFAEMLRLHCIGTVQLRHAEDFDQKTLNEACQVAINRSHLCILERLKELRPQVARVQEECDKKVLAYLFEKPTDFDPKSS